MVERVDISGQLEVSGIDVVVDIDGSSQIIHCTAKTGKPVDALILIRGGIVVVRCPNFYERYCNCCIYGTPDISWFKVMPVVCRAMRDELDHSLAQQLGIVKKPTKLQKTR
jgi:hypothetical protein